MCNISMFSWTIWTPFFGNNSSYIGGKYDEDIGNWFYFDCHLMGCLKIYLNIWILKINK